MEAPVQSEGPTHGPEDDLRTAGGHRELRLAEWTPSRRAPMRQGEPAQAAELSEAMKAIKDFLQETSLTTTLPKAIFP